MVEGESSSFASDITKVTNKPLYVGGVGVSKINVRESITPRESLKPLEIKTTSKPITESKISSSKLESSRISFAKPSSKIESISPRDVSSIISSKGFSVQSAKPKPTASSILQSITSKKPISSTSKIPSSPSSFVSPSSPSSFVSPSSPSSPSSSRSFSSPKSGKSFSSARTLHGASTTAVVRKKRAAAAILTFKSTEYERKKKPKPLKDFLGSTRLDAIEGLFKRSAIIVGDKKTQKQVDIDKKFGRAIRQSKKKVKLF